MDHFPEKDWFEFARGLSPSDARAAMERHLEAGCAQCSQSLRFWTEVLETAKLEPQYEPSAGSVRIVTAAFNQQNPWRPLAAEATVARLIFDSLYASPLAAVRSAMSSDRQLLHLAEPYTIDLRLQLDPVQRRVALVGQILNSENPELGLEDVQIDLTNDKEESVERTSTNSFGEFSIEFSSSDQLFLLIRIQGQKAIGIILPGRPF